MASTIRGLRNIFTLIRGEKPELLYQSGKSAITDEPTKRLVNELSAQAAASMKKLGGLLIFAKDDVDANTFWVKVTTPGKVVIGTATNEVGTNTIDVTVDPIAVAFWLFDQGFTGYGDVPEIADILQWLDKSLLEVITQYAPQASVDAAEAYAKPEPTPEPDEPEKCKNCPAEIKTLCVEVRRDMGIE